MALACEAVRQTALALQYAHERGLLHCDVKPSNLLLVHPPRTNWDSNALTELADGRPLCVKLLDMGLARRMEDSGEPAENDLDGTPDYMAPERGGGEPIDGRSDLYSLGCTFYHLLTGQPPFPGGDGSAKVLRHRIDSPPSARELRPDLPVAVAAVIERLTARDAADRFATGADVATALDVCLAPTAESRCDPAPSACPPVSSPRRPMRRSALLMLAVILGGMVLGAAARWFRPPHAETPALSSLATLPFIVEGRPGGFASLAEAVAAADDGAVVTIHGPGPYPTPPLTWRGRSLTLRAAPGDRPCLEMAAPAADPWQALLTTDRDLILDGLDLRLQPGVGAGSTGRLICCERAALRLTDCRLSAPTGAGIVHRNGGELTLQACRIETGGTALSVEVGAQTTCKVRIVKTTLAVRDPSAAALALCGAAGESAHGRRGGTDGRHVDGGAGDGLDGPAGRRALHGARQRVLLPRCAFSCAGYADRDGWRRMTTWDGRDNRYHGSGVWLNIDGAAAEVRSLAGWRDLWGGEAGSREEPMAVR